MSHAEIKYEQLDKNNGEMFCFKINAAAGIDFTQVVRSNNVVVD